MRSSVDKIDGVFYLSGALDEHFEEWEIMPESGKVVLNLAKVTTVNSQGIFLFLKLMKRLSGIDLELHECSPAVVEMINTFPGTLGVPNRPRVVKSILAEYICPGCTREYERLIRLTMFGQYTVEGIKICSNCGEKLRPLQNMDDLFVFYTDT